MQLVVSDYLNPYRQRLQHVFIASQNAIGRQTGVRSEHIDVGIGVLKHLLLDIDAGLVATLVDRVRAEVFDDFLDHAEEYYKHGRKEAGVIAGVVFEDALGQIAEKNGVADSKVDTIITSLAKKQVFTDVKAKRARAAADVRTKATHAKWSEFDLSDVHNCIVFTRELISSHLQSAGKASPRRGGVLKRYLCGRVQPFGSSPSDQLNGPPLTSGAAGAPPPPRSRGLTTGGTGRTL